MWKGPLIIIHYSNAFQIMPQLLVHLKVDSPGQSIDWGTVVVYSCKNSCSQDKYYIEEVAYKQDYAPISQVMKNHPEVNMY